MKTCTAPKNGVPFSERCGELATWICPLGPRCNECANREIESIKSGECLLSIMADRNGISRENMISKYKRLS